MRSLKEVDQLGLHEYNLLMEAAAYRMVDREKEIHELAWASFIVNKSTKGKRGKPKYTKFEKFFDYDKRLREIQKIIHEGENTDASISRLQRLENHLKGR